jgi:topoisomerase-4 subunit A
MMDIPDKASLSRIELSDGLSANVIIRGKVKVLEGESLSKFLLKRARKGHDIKETKTPVKRQVLLF